MLSLTIEQIHVILVIADWIIHLLVHCVYITSRWGGGGYRGRETGSNGDGKSTGGRRRGNGRRDI